MNPGINDSIPVGPAAPVDVNRYELTNLGLYPEFNERLYLCSLAGKNIDPLKDLIFDRPISPAYKTYIDIISS